MASFTVKGPFEVPLQKSKRSRYISSAEGKQFWQAHEVAAQERGCYVFAFRASKGFIPIYVGKATKSFAQEVFTSHKLVKYNLGLHSRSKGTPVLFFVSLTKSRGPVNKAAIDEVESYLIQAGLVANKNLLNSKKTKLESWSIRGVVRGGSGQPSAAASDLRKCLNF